ncbi:MAG TPA: M28 family peptidase, partial [Rhodopila sp.]|nr:M28 family peptidase [Rhodopila sp.]
MQDQDLQSLCDAVSESELMGHLGELARWVKLSGTPEELESLAYVRSRLDGYGYRTTLLMHDAYISLPGSAQVEVGGRNLACITHSFSRPSAPGGTRAKLLYVGAATPEDLAGRDVAGRILLIDGIASPGASLRATRAGAVGQLHISPHEHLHEMCISPVWGSPTHETVADLPATVVCTISREEGVALRDRLARGEDLEATLQAEVDTRWRKTPILVAEMAGPGPAEAEKFVMFSGHHDTWYYGVMDNGGANSTMLEVARLCASRQREWRRGLRIVFWSGHSHGRYSGSTWYADNHWEELARRCVVHINVDSTGAKGNTVLGDVPMAAELRGLARDAVMRQAGQELTGQRMSRAGDESFWGIGLPSMFMSLGQQPAGTSTDVSASVIGRTGRGERLG